MKENSLLVDGNDVSLNYGMYVVENGWNELIAYPPLKTVDKNDWDEEDGEEADLSKPVLNTKELQINFAISSTNGNYEEFIDLLSDGAYHTFECAFIKRTYKLRLISHPKHDVSLAIGFTSLKFANDFPLQGYEYSAPVSTVISDNGFSFDGKLFTDYGARILQGAESEINKTSSVKQNLLRSSKYDNGAIYDNSKVVYKSKEVKLNILMRAETLAELWNNYDALLYDLIRPKERILSVESVEQEFPCYYKSCSVTSFYPTDRIWLQFTITFVFTRELRIASGYALCIEDGCYITTEDDEDMLIDMHDKNY